MRRKSSRLQLKEFLGVISWKTGLTFKEKLSSWKWLILGSLYKVEIGMATVKKYKGWRRNVYTYRVYLMRSYKELEKYGMIKQAS